MATRNLRLDWVALDDLKGNPANPKDHDLGALEQSFSRFGMVAPVVLNERDGTLLAGHGRVEALRAMRDAGESPPQGVKVARGSWSVQVVRGVDLDDRDARAYLVADNRTTELGGWLERDLVDLLRSLEGDGGLEGTGFDLDDLDDLVRSLQEEGESPVAAGGDPNYAPPFPEKVWVTPGLYELGVHRLLVGDCTEAGALEALLAGEVATMTFTDPPYNVDYGRHGGASRKKPKRAAMQNDAMDAESWGVFVGKFAEAILSNTDGAIYVCMSSKEWPTVDGILRTLGGHWSDTIIWVKDAFVLGRADYQRQYEPIWYGWREGAQHFFTRSRKEADVWGVVPHGLSVGVDNGDTLLEFSDGIQRLEVKLQGRVEGTVHLRQGDTNIWTFARDRNVDVNHPTKKPVELVERAIWNSSREGDLVLDPFGGSGTTLIAAERLRRRAVLAEIDPRYGQVIIERWQALTGGRAQRVER